jgi:hypothetical protein
MTTFKRAISAGCLLGAIAARSWAQVPTPPDWVRGGRAAAPPRSGEVIRLLAGEELAGTDAAGDQSGWIWHYPSYSSQYPKAQGKDVSVAVSHTVLGGSVGFIFQAISYGDDTAGNLDNAPNSDFTIWRRESGKVLQDPVNAGVPPWADFRRIEISRASQAGSKGQVTFGLRFAEAHPSSGKGVSNFTFSDGVPAANLTFVRNGSFWWHYLYLGSRGHYGSGPINDLVKAALRGDNHDGLTLQIEVGAPIPSNLPDISGRPYYDVVFPGNTKRIEVRWFRTNPNRGRWVAFVREFRGGVWEDVKSLPVLVRDNKFIVTFKKGDASLGSPVRWYVVSGGETGIGNDVYFCPFDSLPNSGILEQP